MVVEGAVMMVMVVEMVAVVIVVVVKQWCMHLEGDMYHYTADSGRSSRLT